MKMKNEDKNEDLFYFTKIFQIILFWNFEIRWFQICFQIFHILLRSKVTALQSSQKMVKNGQNRQNGPTLEGCNFWWKKDMKNLNAYLKSASFEASEKYKLKYFNVYFSETLNFTDFKYVFRFFISFFH